MSGWVAYLAAVPLALLVLALRPGWWRGAVALVALGHVTVLVSVALFPLPVDPDVIADGRAAALAPYAGTSLNLTPFATLGPVIVGRAAPLVRETALLNLFVLTPAGVYLPLLFPRLRRWRSFLPVALAAGASVELAQLAVSLVLGFRYRSIDVDDLIANAAGIVIGWLAFRLVVAASRPRKTGPGGPVRAGIGGGDDRIRTDE